MPLKFVPLNDDACKIGEKIEFHSETGLIRVTDYEGRTYLLRQIVQMSPQEVIGVDIYGNLIKIRLIPPNNESNPSSP
ncbi:MAG: hypothetical protein GXO26_04360 [Crenarchaeota archaeon]|nr:hypothetical protein [Thermoproteota archaeon]